MGKRTNIGAVNTRGKIGGFALLESIVAVGVLTAAIVGPLYFAGKSITSATLAKNQLVAFYLAEEGVEYVRNARDGNFLAGASGWLDGLEDCVEGGTNGNNGCDIDAINPNVVACLSGGCPKIKYYDNGAGGGYYNYSNGGNTIFTRTIKIKPVAGTDYEKKITATVGWNEKYGYKEMTLEENIFNWH